MNERELAAFISAKLNYSLNEEGGEVSDVRQKTYDYYLGEEYGNERDGHSRIVTREVFEAVEWAMPSILRVFTGDRPVAFIPEEEEDETAAEQETDVINHLMFNQENGFLAIHNWAKDALMYPNGYAKVWVVEEDAAKTHKFEDLTIEQVAALDEKDEIEITEASAEDRATEYGLETVYDVTVKETYQRPVLKFEAVPPDEVLVDGDLTSIDLDEADFVCHSTRKPITSLVQQGYDQKRLEKVAEDRTDYGEEDTNRRHYDDENPNTTEDDASMKMLRVDECYLMVDFDGDGLAEKRQVVKIGNEIFENSLIDYQPLIAMSSIIQSHKHTGISLAETVMDLQEASSALMRQLLTNLYRINVPRKYVAEDGLVDGGMTTDSLLDAASEIIMVARPGMIEQETIPPIVQHILPVMQSITEQKQLRTGVNPSISLNPDVLRESTQGAFTAALDHASQRLEMIIRVMAETGVKQAMRKAHQLIRENFSNTLQMQLRNEWVTVNPMEWKERTNLKVRVGVGTQNKQERQIAMQQILALQEKLLGIGMARPEHVYNAVSEALEAAGVEGVDRFIANPSKEEIQQKPDPLGELAQKQGQAMMVEAESKMGKLEVEREKVALDARRQEFDAMMAEQTRQLEARIDIFEAESKAGESQAKVKNIQSDTDLKDAQKVKVLEEARSLDIDNDAAESGVVSLLSNG